MLCIVLLIGGFFGHCCWFFVLKGDGDDCDETVDSKT